jgi:hypothetical protein
MKFLPFPSDSPLTFMLVPSDLFTDNQIEEHGLTGASWELDLKCLTQGILIGIESNTKDLQLKRKDGELFDGDKSGMYEPTKKIRRR